MNENHDAAVEAQIQAKGLTTGPRVTPEQVDAWMERVAIMCAQIPGTTTMVAHALLDGTFYLGTTFSACVSPENFDENLGMDIASRKCIDMVREKAWELLGYELYSQQHAA